MSVIEETAYLISKAHDELNELSDDKLSQRVEILNSYAEKIINVYKKAKSNKTASVEQKNRSKK